MNMEMEAEKPSSTNSQEDLDSTGKSRGSMVTGSNCAVPRARIFLVSAVSFVLATLIVLLVVLNNIKMSSNAKNGKIEIDGMVENKCIDVAIVGAGMSGLSAAWYLRHHNGTVTLFESTSRIGGNIDTQTLPDFGDQHLEMGEWYFGPYFLSSLNSTLHALDLYSDVIEILKWDGRLNRVRGVTSTPGDISKVLALFGLNDIEMKTPASFYRSLLEELGNSTTDQATMSMEEAIILASGSTESLNYLHAMLDHRHYHGDAGALSMMDAIEYSAPKHPKFTLSSAGMKIIPELLLIEFLNSHDRHNLKLSHKISSIEMSGENVQFSFYDSHTSPESLATENSSDSVTTFCAKHVILTVSPSEIEAIKYNGVSAEEEQSFRHQLSSTNEHKDISFYVLYSMPWWRQSEVTYLDTGQWLHSDTPLKVVVDLGTWTKDVIHRDPDDTSTGIEDISVLQFVPDLITYRSFWGDSFQTRDEENILTRSEAILENIFSLPISTNITRSIKLGTFITYTTWKPGRDIDATSMKPFHSKHMYVLSSAFGDPTYQLYPIDASVAAVNDFFLHWVY